MINSLPMRNIQHVHFVGIGGVGMGGVAQILLSQGYQVSGSDLSESAMTAHLRCVGARIFIAHCADNVGHADVVVFSNAVDSAHNVELQAARQAGIPVIPRAQMLGELMRARYGIAIAGTHGKTTTSALITRVLIEGGLDPTFIIGGKLTAQNAYAQLGSGPYLVAETDESDASFLHLHPLMTVVTNIDADHLDAYQDQLSRLHETFLAFLHHLPFYGVAIVCSDDPVLRHLLPRIARPVLTYGENEQADIRLMDYTPNALKSQFRVARQGHFSDLNITLNLPGKHNALNALAAIAVATECGASDQAITTALSQFSGVARRFSVYDHLSLGRAHHITCIDDYGHHPREIAVTLEVIRQAWPNRRVVWVFQPHRFSRTQALFEEFVAVLSQVDVLLLLAVYPAGEKPILGADGRALYEAIAKNHTLPITFIDCLESVPAVLAARLKSEDIVVVQGAGTVGQLGQWMSRLSGVE